MAFRAVCERFPKHEPRITMEMSTITLSLIHIFPYAIAALIYWVFCLFIEFILGRVEKKLAYYHD